MNKEIYPFGNLPDGQTAELCVLRSSCAEVGISTLGATIVSVRTPDRNGVWEDIALGFSSAPDYLKNSGCLGATIGRYAGRIANGRFPLNGETVHLSQNRMPHTIHGGAEGFHRRLWSVFCLTEEQLGLELRSPDGDQGFPGAMVARATFTLCGDTLTMQISCVSDADTVCSITNHVYWNLAGHGSGTVDGHILSLRADGYLETDAETIPTGRIFPVQGTAFDLNDPRLLRGAEFDHTFLLPEAEGVQTVGRIYEPASGRTLEISTDLPAVQVYTSDHLPQGMAGKNGAHYYPRSGVCLEAQMCPDSPNHENFPSAFLRKGEEWKHEIRWQFGVSDENP